MESAGIEESLAESVGIKESLGISKVIPNHVDHIPKWRTPRAQFKAVFTTDTTTLRIVLTRFHGFPPKKGRW